MIDLIFLGTQDISDISNSTREALKIIYLSTKHLAKNVYKKVRNAYTAAVSKAKHDHYHIQVGEAKGNVKKLYHVTSSLLGKKQENPLPSHVDDTSLANDFLRFFSEKISKLRDELDNIDNGMPVNNTCVNMTKSYCSTSMHEFKELSKSKLIKQSKPTTCEFDIISSVKRKENLEYFLPIITKIINISLNSGTFHEKWKCAVIRPLINKMAKMAVDSSPEFLRLP